MIPKAQLLTIAKNYKLLPNTVQKDYVIGWLLRSISQHEMVSKWVFKGGTCLKKCYFETYRFSEDLDFTIPTDHIIDVNSIESYLEEITTWIESNSGLTFPRQDWKIDEYKNLRGNTSYKVKISYVGPLGGAPKSLPRVKFDLTQDELIVDTPQLQEVHHVFSDQFDPIPKVLCYSIEEILAEKTRALFERQGRARDVYDVVNISRNFRKRIDAKQVEKVAKEKFEFKKLAKPSVDTIISAIDAEVLKANWEHQLSHQLIVLPSVEFYLNDLRDAIAWWLEPVISSSELNSMPQAEGTLAPRAYYPSANWQYGPSSLDVIRQAAQNRLCAIVKYDDKTRLVEPYSLRYPSTGNEILHVWEIEKNGRRSDSHKSFKVHEIESASMSDQSFQPKWKVEL